MIAATVTRVSSSEIREDARRAADKGQVLVMDDQTPAYMLVELRSLSPPAWTYAT
jgi:hypothetical protein